MYDSQVPFVDLLERLMRDDGAVPLGESVSDWIATAGAQRAWLRGLRTQLEEADQRPPVLEPETAARLYALSRCLDWLICSMTNEEPTAAVAEYVSLVTGLGLRVHTPCTFHPFDCEIHRVTQAPDADVAPSLRRVHWPAARLGPLMIQRAGVTVRAGANHIHKDTAETSTLYWAWMRNRPREDLSDGWGHNSQWDTALRLDYETPDKFYYNLRDPGGRKSPPNDSFGEMPQSEIRDLIRYRCHIYPSEPPHDPWPYDISVVEPRAH